MSSHSPELTAWLAAEERRLVTFASRSRTANAFGYLQDDGSLDHAAGSQLWIVTRMTYVFSIALLRGDPGMAELAEHGVKALREVMVDDEDGGWHSQIDASGRPLSDRKSGYDHSFVLLAAAAASIAGVRGAEDLLAEATKIIEQRFWDADQQVIRDTYSRDWSELEDYRGANANMHFVEACLATATATGDDIWIQRAAAVADRLINKSARDNHWRLLEHYTGEWDPTPDFNRDRPTDQFRPYGYVVGHSMEWARLLVQLDLALREADLPARAWLVPAAQSLWERALQQGWEADGRPGFIYTQGWDDEVIIDRRLQWVVAEATGAAWALDYTLGGEHYTSWNDRFWDHIRSAFVDTDQGSWHHELDPEGRPSTQVWSGKPDIYHAYQAVVHAQVPLGTSLGAGLASPS